MYIIVYHLFFCWNSPKTTAMQVRSKNHTTSKNCLLAGCLSKKSISTKLESVCTHIRSSRENCQCDSRRSCYSLITLRLNSDFQTLKPLYFELSHLAISQSSCIILRGSPLKTCHNSPKLSTEPGLPNNSAAGSDQ